jgi:hypothetical protein
MSTADTPIERAIHHLGAAKSAMGDMKAENNEFQRGVKANAMRDVDMAMSRIYKFRWSQGDFTGLDQNYHPKNLQG